MADDVPLDGVEIGDEQKKETFSAPHFEKLPPATHSVPEIEPAIGKVCCFTEKTFSKFLGVQSGVFFVLMVIFMISTLIAVKAGASWETYHCLSLLVVLFVSAGCLSGALWLFLTGSAWGLAPTGLGVAILLTFVGLLVMDSEFEASMKILIAAMSVFVVTCVGLMLVRVVDWFRKAPCWRR
jgi:hypothetical protein